MNLERGFSVPQQKGNVWVPATPEKALVGMQQSEKAEENWEELLGLYTGVLKDETCSALPQECDPTNLVLNQNQQAFAPDSRPPDLNGLSCGMNNVQNVAFVGSQNRLLPQISNPTHIVGVDHRAHTTQDAEKFMSFNQNAASMGSNRQNRGDAVSPTEVYSLAELMGMKSGQTAPKQMAERSTCVVDKATSSISLHSQVERNWQTYRSDSTVHMQNHILQANQDAGGYNMQQIPTSRLSVAYRPSYNLNLSPRSEAEEYNSAARPLQPEPATPDKQKLQQNNRILQVPYFSVDAVPANEAGEYSSAARPLQPGPATPDKQKLQQSNKILQVPYFSIDAVSAKENNKQDNAVLPAQADIGERVCNGFEHDALGASPAANSTMPTENENNGGRNDGEIDLNKTPPQKTPKRRKHRPKVVKEGKPKRTPKPKATENNTPGGKSTTKRKYVRKKGIKTSADQSNDATNGVDVSNVEPPQPKSCKRALNFDLENVVEKKIKGRENDHQADNIEGSKLDLNVDFHSAELKGQSTSSVENVQNICSKGKPTENLYDFIHSVDKITPQESTVPPTAPKDHTLNVLARILNVPYANTNLSGRQGMNGQVRNHIGGDLAQILANTRKQLDGNRQPKHLNMPQCQEDSVDVSEKQESKREYSYTDNTRPPMVSQIWPHGVSDTGHHNRENREFWQNCLEASRTKHVEDQICGRKSSIPSGNTTAEDCSEQIHSTLNMSIRAESSKLHLNGGLPYVSGEQKSTFIDLTGETNMVIHPSYMNSADLGNKFKNQVNASAEHMAHRAHHFAKAQTTSSLTAVSNCHMVLASQRDSQVTKGNETIGSPARLSVKRQAAARQKPSNIISKNLQGSGHDSKKVTGPCEYKRNTLSIDFITDRMKDLQIDNNGKETVQGEQNALVPFRGDGAVVPFEAFDPIKKRQPRPKVDLDPETNRLWNLLMGKEGTERAQTMDNGTQKNWEEERKVFRGRVDSFIARMHLVQGDRRFSKWKGSVVDSVIGVFLTQNVSDHLSSSAFMSLAAKFPLKSTTMKGSFCHNRGNPSNEHEVSYSVERTPCHDPLAREPVADHSSITSSQLSQHRTENVASGKSLSIYNHTGRKEECMISSQSSSGSVSFQASDDIRSSAGSNSEVEDHITGSSFRKTFGPLNFCEEAERTTAFQQYEVQETRPSLADNKPSNDVQQPEKLVQIQNPGVASSRNAYFSPLTSSVQHYQRPVPPSTNYWQEMLMGVEERELDLLEFVGKECTFSMTSTYFDTTNGTGIEHAQDKASRSAESSLTDQQTRSSKSLNHKVVNKQPEQQMNFPTESQSRNSQHFINFSQRGKQETSQKESSCIIDPEINAEAFRQKQDKQKPSENITPGPMETKTTASNVQSSKVRTTPNARKRKAEKEKVEPFDWDILRKGVESKAGTKGKSSNALDSLDYEALRNADVHEISKTIKERGMNNMLAERMKDFLNRLVKDHGSIDLEWLRDVQQDKAKDYLLSIRGLGLKSVECVRLLTLHHLAFPVDTNVGRIAVRLGWVPLQPLPETLQLHLLELYPVLESIQKYLWPRLCMLDQETLYELHYQLITFGKVFCTKRQPNCNACPMRGECRHFASAFASARLALPGPEEKRIVCSDVPSSSSKSCGAIIKPMLLAPGGDNLGRTPEIMRNCEPVIEEPATPEASIEMSERDIEDAFFEDPDEIPEIKLNIEEFTSNLQSFIEEKMEMQEGDMSKALVALSPEFASIPMPKLKQVSRLRTEHQVYELPDSHPLLKGLDKREPDDPSPYLLAIWAPGETADSTEPTDSKSCSSKGGPCNQKVCLSCNGTREAEAQTVRGTILIPCRTAMRGSFPLNGTYFQVNEVFADNETSMNPIDVPRSFIWNLARRTVFFGTSVSTIFRGMSTEDIQYCFWKGFVCVRGFDQKTRAPRPLKARLHLAASRIAKKNE